MVKVTMPTWRAEMQAQLRSMGIDPNNCARLVIDMQPGSFYPVMHVEMIGDARIIDLGAVLAGAEDVRVSRSETPQPVFRLHLRAEASDGDDGA